MERSNARAGIPLKDAGGLPPIRTQFAAPTQPATPKIVSEDVLTSRKARVSGAAQPQYLGTQLDVSRIQNALRAAERGDTWMLFTIFRDMEAGFAHLIAEWEKRKLVIAGQPETLVPYSDSEDDKLACEVIKEAIHCCPNWSTGLRHLLRATLWPMSVCEKIFEPISPSSSARFKHLNRFYLKSLAPVDPIAMCFKVPYQGTNGLTPAATYNPDDWEAWLRFYGTTENGNINYSMSDIYKPNPAWHIVHHGNAQSVTIPPNWGGLMRPLLFIWLLTTQDRDWWAMFMQKYGMPFILAKADAQQKDTVDFLNSQIQLATQIGGLVIDRRAQAELVQAQASDGANSHKMFTEFFYADVSKLVIGQTLSSKPEKTGMGSGAANQSEEIRDDIRTSDTTALSDTLSRQLFRQILDLNGYTKCNAPKVYWGGMRPATANQFAQTLNQLGAGGYELTDEALEEAGHKFGYTLQRREEPTNNKLASDKELDNGKLVKYSVPK